MKTAVRQLIQAAKAASQKRRPELSRPSNVVVGPVLVDLMLQEKEWNTFSELALKYGLSHDKIAKDFKGRDGVAKFGSDYRVSMAAQKAWLTECLMQGRRKVGW